MNSRHEGHEQCPVCGWWHCICPPKPPKMVLLLLDEAVSYNMLGLSANVVGAKLCRVGAGDGTTASARKFDGVGHDA